MFEDINKVQVEISENRDLLTVIESMSDNTQRAWFISVLPSANTLPDAVPPPKKWGGVFNSSPGSGGAKKAAKSMQFRVTGTEEERRAFLHRFQSLDKRMSNIKTELLTPHESNFLTPSDIEHVEAKQWFPFSALGESAHQKITSPYRLAPDLITPNPGAVQRDAVRFGSATSAFHPYCRPEAGHGAARPLTSLPAGAAEARGGRVAAVAGQDEAPSIAYLTGVDAGLEWGMRAVLRARLKTL